MTGMINQDDEHLRLLSVFHYVVAGITALFACFPIIHLIIGIAMLSGALDGPFGEHWGGEETREPAWTVPAEAPPLELVPAEPAEPVPPEPVPLEPGPAKPDALAPDAPAPPGPGAREPDEAAETHGYRSTPARGHRRRSHGFPGTFFGVMFVVFPAIFILCGWTLAVLLFIAGRCLARRKHHMFCLVIAGIRCLFMPFGTVLGVFTLIVLMRPSVKAQFQSYPPLELQP